MNKNIMERVRSYEDACSELKIPARDFTGLDKDEVAYFKLKTIIKALNEGWEADYEDSNQKKWFPWFDASLGVSFAGTDFGYLHPYVGSSAHLCFKDEKIAEYAGKKFLELWKDFIL